MDELTRLYERELLSLGSQYDSEQVMLADAPPWWEDDDEAGAAAMSLMGAIGRRKGS